MPLPFMENRSFMAPTCSYAPSEAPVRFSSNWRDIFKKKPTTIWSVPGSEADCPYDVDDLAFDGENHERVDDDHDDHVEQAEEDGMPMETHSVTQYNTGSIYNDMPAAPEDSLETFLKNVHRHIQSFTEQFERQNTYNEAIQRKMETVAQEYCRLRALEEAVDAMREELNSLSRAKNDPTVRRKVGRPGREAQ